MARMKAQHSKRIVSRSVSGSSYLLNTPPRTAPRSAKRSFWWEYAPGQEQRLRADNLQRELARLERTCSEHRDRPLDREELFDWSGA